MDDLIAFLYARLHEDEQTALSWPDDSRQWQTVGSRKLSYRNGGFQIVTAIDVSNASSLWNEQIYVKYDLDDAPEHIARHDPARVLAEVEAKRRILDGYDKLHCGPERLHDPALHLQWNVLQSVVRTLALPYAGHPDYNHEWRP